MSMRHFISDDDGPGHVVDTLMDAVPSGSYLLLSHLSSDIQARMEAWSARRPQAVSPGEVLVAVNWNRRRRRAR